MMAKILNQIRTVADRYDELQAKLVQPDFMADSARYTAALREAGSIQRTAQLYREYEGIVRQREEAESIIKAGDDAEMVELARGEVKELGAREETILEDLKRSLVAEDADAKRNVIMEIRAGTGGEEACLFAGDLLRMYSRYAERQGWTTEILESHPTELGGYKDVMIAVKGEGAYARLRFESGGHRVQRVPVTESQGRIQTSAATVAVLPEVEAVEVDIDSNDLKIDTFRAGGPGGQNVNKTSSAVRITHLPSGLVVNCQDESSQHKNKSKAMKILASRLYEQVTRERDQARAENRKSQIGSGDRSQRVRTYHWGRSQVNDHRISSAFGLDRVLDGDLNPLFDELRELDIKEKLENLS